MNIKKLAPWNWFKDEEKSEGMNVPVVRQQQQNFYPLGQLHQEIDRVFDNMFRSFGFPTLGFEGSLNGPGHSASLLRPNVDIAATDKEYTIAVEVPGVEQNNVKLELVDDSLVVKGEKVQERENKDRNYHRIERSYGSFQRVLSLPEDADRDGINAAFKNGVLTITLPRKAVTKTSGKVIEIRQAA